MGDNSGSFFWGVAGFLLGMVLYSLSESEKNRWRTEGYEKARVELTQKYKPTTQPENQPTIRMSEGNLPKLIEKVEAGK